MQEVITGDGSITFQSPDVDECYHTKSGAVEEAFEKYAKPVHIELYKTVHVLDFCFGLGYNTAAALDQFKGDRIEIICLENDPRIIEKIKEIKTPFLSWDVLREVAEYKQYEDATRKIELRMGDARLEIKKLFEEGKKFDVIFFDPFSPQKSPHMWTKEIFEDIKKLMNTAGVLATYSCASAVRTALRDAGFKVRDGPSVGRKSPSTLAYV